MGKMAAHKIEKDRAMRTKAILVMAMVALLACYAQSAVYGPTPYLSFADSPFYGGSFDYFYLEDFEDGAFGTPGVSHTTCVIRGPSSTTDSVDADDGTIDGYGTAGYSLAMPDGYGNSVTFTFNAGTLGTLPTHVGIVWTDVGMIAGPYGNVTFQAYDALNALVATVGPAYLGDGSCYGETAEDRFFGATYTAGIKKIVFSMDDDDWSMDHLQYGAIPEPASAALLLLGFSSLLWRRKKRQ